MVIVLVEVVGVEIMAGVEAQHQHQLAYKHHPVPTVTLGLTMVGVVDSQAMEVVVGQVMEVEVVDSQTMEVVDGQVMEVEVGDNQTMEVVDGQVMEVEVSQVMEVVVVDVGVEDVEVDHQVADQ